MSESVEAAPPPARSGRGRRRFQILILAILGVVVLWTAGWLALRHYVGGRIDALEARAAAEGAILACGDRSIGGFPFRIDVSCMPVAASCPAEAVSFDLAGIEAAGLAYNPGRALFAARGPLSLKGPDGAGVEANWKALRSSVRLGFSGLSRYSLVVEGLDATLAAPDRLPAPVPLSAGHVEFHAVPAAADMLDLYLSLDQFTATPPGRPSLPPLDAALSVAVPAEIVLNRGDTALRWAASGKPISIERLETSIGGVGAQLSGALTPGADGLLSGSLTVRIDQLDRLPDLVDQLAPGSGPRVRQVLGLANMLLRPVTIDGRAWREASVTVSGGRVLLGFIPLGVLPRIGPPPPEPIDVQPAPPAEAEPAPNGPPTAEPPPAPAAAPPSADAGTTQPTPVAPEATAPPPAPVRRCTVTS